MLFTPAAMSRRLILCALAVLAASPACVADGPPVTEGEAAALSSLMCQPAERGGFGTLTSLAQRALEEHVRAHVTQKYTSADATPLAAEVTLFSDLHHAGAIDGTFDETRVRLASNTLLLTSAESDVTVFRKAVVEIEKDFRSGRMGINGVTIEALDERLEFERIATCLPTFGDYCQVDAQTIVVDHARRWMASGRLADPRTNEELQALFDDLAASGLVGGRFDTDRVQSWLANDSLLVRVSDGFWSPMDSQLAVLTLRVVAPDRLELVSARQRWIPWRQHTEPDGTVVSGGLAPCDAPAPAAAE